MTNLTNRAGPAGRRRRADGGAWCAGRETAVEPPSCGQGRTYTAEEGARTGSMRGSVCDLSSGTFLRRACGAACGWVWSCNHAVGRGRTSVPNGSARWQNGTRRDLPSILSHFVVREGSPWLRQQPACARAVAAANMLKSRCDHARALDNPGPLRATEGSTIPADALHIAAISSTCKGRLLLRAQTHTQCVVRATRGVPGRHRVTGRFVLKHQTAQ